VVVLAPVDPFLQEVDSLLPIHTILAEPPEHSTPVVPEPEHVAPACVAEVQVIPVEPPEQLEPVPPPEQPSGVITPRSTSSNGINIGLA